MSQDSKDPYDVGYGKPSLKTQFKKGQSGNPGGRPKAKSVDSKIALELDELITVNQNGIRSRISKREAIVRQIFNKALQGDIASQVIVLTRLNNIQRREQLLPYIIKYYKGPMR